MASWAIPLNEALNGKIIEPNGAFSSHDDTRGSFWTHWVPSRSQPNSFPTQPQLIRRWSLLSWFPVIFVGPPQLFWINSLHNPFFHWQNQHFRSTFVTIQISVGYKSHVTRFWPQIPMVCGGSSLFRGARMGTPAKPSLRSHWRSCCTASRRDKMEPWCLGQAAAKRQEVSSFKMVGS